ncbi:MAG: PIG-L family deacetylase [Phycisphaerae bacterium]|nr:PIG-L family deacetylase [Phycisphaerae bacterium]NIS51457.1 PIG-L family deacetylase [Phycisphaerae bacterium]NIU09069.1 PIG-L family deacetylase [Phycisphaerae bacterium]NIU56729.1 PIG-L family deacetylase [Phycisphaerae bacterium]NIW93176.1 PIG-L family deacetylase [Phycisphaerae bacterium]
MKYRARDFRSCVVIVAHPDDETLWAGGTILMHPESEWTVVTLCRKSDPDRAPRFYRVMERLRATGVMGDVDDGPEQTPLNGRKVQAAILELLPSNSFDVILTHGLHGEYTRHRRHEETAEAVRALWESKELCAKELWMFAYEDGGGNYLPKAVDDADVKVKLPDEIWREKYNIVTNVYGFGPESFEAETTPKEEAFYFFQSG